MPTPRGSLAAATLGGRIHAVGGLSGPRKNTRAHEVYDPATDRWSKRTPLPTRRDYLAVAVLGGRLYVVGGRVRGKRTNPLSVNEEYDPGGNAWRNRPPPIPSYRGGIAAAALGGKIFVFGGEGIVGTLRRVDAFHLKERFWSTRAPMPTGRHGLAAVAAGGKIFVISGGTEPSDTLSGKNEVYLPGGGGGNGGKK
jgi:N-acetylneuraminic acid mutarotase